MAKILQRSEWKLKDEQQLTVSEIVKLVLAIPVLIIFVIIIAGMILLDKAL